MSENGVCALVDATHPFAVRMAANAREAARLSAVPLIKLERSHWQAKPDDRWEIVADGQAAAARLPTLGTRPFLTIGAQGLAPFLVDPAPWALVRLIEPMDLPVGWERILDRGPFDEAGEIAVMTRFGIDLLVTKQSGGTATIAKINAARTLRLPVLMIARPIQDQQTSASDGEAVLAWLDAGLKQ